MNISNGPFDEQYAQSQLTSYYKQGYCTIEAMVTFLRNDYRDLTLDEAVKIVNRWIDANKINYEHLAIAYNKRLKKRVVVTTSFIEKLRKYRECKYHEN